MHAVITGSLHAVTHAVTLQFAVIICSPFGVSLFFAPRFEQRLYSPVSLSTALLRD